MARTKQIKVTHTAHRKTLAQATQSYNHAIAMIKSMIVEQYRARKKTPPQDPALENLAKEYYSRYSPN